ncbi:hypothetical protein EDD53_1076 [Pacificibacter maritimus]|uniref:Imelysin-like domain-containing protein n=1 Tax=Pacificibacter maritimus TaxID=762213 RepID=A0A3N4UNC3_9RHOB|nr:imelysin family protein [Pacificibacter maritimus]RPE71943.1 hypothetical protein EDD53_1076 [Pacificibacter maritimus]
MKHAIALIAALWAAPVVADVARSVDTYILPSYAALAESTARLRDQAGVDCAPAAVRPAWNAAFDDWLHVSPIHFGPVEQDGRAVIIAFWPDGRSAGPRALARLIAEEDPIISTAEGTAKLSAAARGFYALEHLLFDAQFVDTTAYSCDLIRAVTADLAHMSADIEDAWMTGYAESLRSAGATGNETFLSEREGIQILFTSLLAGLEFTADTRLGRPLGSFENPRPKRAESWRSGRSLRNVSLSLQGLQALKNTLSDLETPVTDAGFERAFTLIAQLDDPVLAGVADPQSRLKIEVLQQAVKSIKEAAEVELSALLGVEAGFNAADGD